MRAEDVIREWMADVLWSRDSILRKLPGTHTLLRSHHFTLNALY